VQTHEWLLTAAVIVIPLIIAVIVTLWSLEQARYRPKKRRPANALPLAPTDGDGSRGEPGTTVVDASRP